MSTIFPAVTGYKNGADNKVEAGILNRPINQLRQRTDYLYNRLAILAGSNAFDSIRLQDISLDPDDMLQVGDVVYLDPTDRVYRKAIVDNLVSPVYPFSYAAETSFAVGVMISVSGGYTTGTLVTSGRILIDDVNSMLETGETFRNGPYYLSPTSAGKLTAIPTDIAVYIGYFVKDADGDSGYAIINPQLKDMWEAHLHRRFIIASQPAGDFETTGTDIDDVHYIRGFEPGDIAEAPVRMYLLGPYTGSDIVTYEIRIDTPDDIIGTARVYWRTSDGSDDSFPGFDDPEIPGYDPDYGWTIGQPIGFYGNKVSIGSNGMYVVFENNASFADYPTTDFLTLALTGVAAADRTWTIETPTAIKGWLGHTFNEVAEYTGPNADPEYRMHIFGQYKNSNNRITERFTISIDAAGDFTDTLDGVDITVKDIDGNTVGSWTEVTFSENGIVELIAGDNDLSLWLQVSKYDENGVAATTTTAALDDTWSVEITDEAPNAKFVYNIEADAALSAYYPPKPMDGIVFEMNGVALAERNFFADDSGSYKPTLRTIFWYPDTYADAPYPESWDPVTPVEEWQLKNMLVYFTNRRAAQSSIVTSLRPAEGSPVVIRDCATGEPATAGDLEILVQLNFDLEDSNLAGYKVVKEISEEGKLRTGPIVERIKAGSNVSISSTDGDGHGTVTISAESEGITVGDFNLITFQNAKQEKLPGGSLFSFTKLLPWTTGANNIYSGFTAQVTVPYTLDGRYKLMFYTTVFGLGNEATRKAAALKMTYSVLQDYVTPGGAPPELVEKSLLTDALTNTHSQDVYFGTTVSGYTAYDPFVLHNDPEFTPLEGAVSDQFYQPLPTDTDTPNELTAGDVVALKFERTNIIGSADEYTSAIGFVRLRWRLEPITE